MIDGGLRKNKYKNWHDQIITRAKQRLLNVYFERHHIKPKSFGGKDSKGNVVKLTYREHFLIHWLLVKINRGEKKRKMWSALHFMIAKGSKNRIINSWQYAIAQKANYEWQKNRKLSEQQIAHLRKLALGQRGKPKANPHLIGNQHAKNMRHSDKTKEIIREANLGRKHSEEHNKKKSAGIKLAWKRRKGFKQTEETKNKISALLFKMHASKRNVLCQMAT